MKNSSMFISIPVIVVMTWTFVSSFMPPDIVSAITTFFFNTVGYAVAGLLVICPTIALLGFALRD